MSFGPMAFDQTVIDPLRGVPLLGRSIQVSPQHPVDQRFEGIEPRLHAPLLLPRLGPLHVQSPPDRPPRHRRVDELV
ncbi:hypothetical protein ACWDSD_45240 [Streptomyces spiralis]